MEGSDKVAQARNAIIAFVLNNVENRLPMKDEEMSEVLDKDKALFKQCFPLAQAALKKTYGIIMQKIPESKKYICYSELAAASPAEYDEEQRRRLTLLFLILSYILMKDYSVYEEQLFHFLDGLRIDVNEDHPYFGSNLKKLITDTFVKQLYLEKKKSTAEHEMETKYLYGWGYRSQLEFPGKDVLTQTAKILNKSPKEFFAQYDKYFIAAEKEVMEVD